MFEERRTFADPTPEQGSDLVAIPVELLERLTKFAYDPYAPSEQSELYVEMQTALASERIKPLVGRGLSRLKGMLDSWRDGDSEKSPMRRAEHFAQSAGGFA